MGLIRFFSAGVVVLGFWLFPSCSHTEESSTYPEVSGIYPHLAMYNSSGECGQGAVVAWAGRLWVVTYAPHAPYGSDDGLYEIDSSLHMVRRPESTGGTPANRMIHEPSGQLIIGPYFIDSTRKVRVIPYESMPGRLTATAAHLTDPRHKVYMATMEEGLYEVDVRTLHVKVLFPDGNADTLPGIDRPRLPGDHGKGAYTGQGVLARSNNGSHRAAGLMNYRGHAGCLAEWDGKHPWRVVFRTPFTEVTGPGGICGNGCKEDPLWAVGWDHRSLLLAVREEGRWYTFRLPKASLTYDAPHGWFTEWPRIRSVEGGRMLMTMFGMFWDFPHTFSLHHTGGITPLSSFLKMVVDFTRWGDRLVFACDDASTLQNPFVGRSHSNLWFVRPEELTRLGPAEAAGALLFQDTLPAGRPTDPFLVHGFEEKILHLHNGSQGMVRLTLEADTAGEGAWHVLHRFFLQPGAYVYWSLPDDRSIHWVRLVSNRAAGPLSAWFFVGRAGTGQEEGEDIFRVLARASEAGEAVTGLVRPLGDMAGTLAFLCRDERGQEEGLPYRMDERLQLLPDKEAEEISGMVERFAIQPSFAVDEASVILTGHDGRRYRVPFGDSVFFRKMLPPQRGLREVVTERYLLNAMGTFFEVPRPSAGGYGGMRPVAAHDRLITDFCSWRGMLVLTGVRKDAPAGDHCFRSRDGQAALWLGNVDDLWHLGKPRGFGGPWKDTPVNGDETSDPYLMYGYDRKKLFLQSDRPVEITAEVCFDKDLQEWVALKRFHVDEQGTTWNFPAGYRARWIRFVSNVPSRVTAYLEYF